MYNIRGLRLRGATLKRIFQCCRERFCGSDIHKGCVQAINLEKKKKGRNEEKETGGRKKNGENRQFVSCEVL